MIDSYLWSNIFFAFLVGGTWVALSTIAADRLGSKIGGFLIGLPSTAIVAFLFIGIVQGPQVASQATSDFPLIYGFTGLFLIFFALISKKGFWIGLCGSLAVWFALTLSVAVLGLENFELSLIIYLMILLFVYFIPEEHLRIRPQKTRSTPISLKHLAFRAVFSGAIIAFAVFLSKAGGPLFGGAFAAFPAGFISALIIGNMARGLEFSRTLAKPMAVSGLVTVVLYAIALRYAYPAYGLALGTLASMGVSLIGAAFLYYLIKR
ncbi:MAG: DUF3147 family protein [Candidatus Micrarchaeota archaeon]|nr:DUF3147 family protein [Candidatus Micrarchaeota archaeon]